MMVVLLLSGFGASANPAHLAPPAPEKFAIDTTGTISGPTLDTLHAIGRALDQSGKGQLGVLVVRTTSGVPPRRFATDAFNFWGIGHAGLDDGVFIMVALDDRKAELVVGKGEPLTTQQTDAIMADDIVANMKRQLPEAALLDAARAVLRELTGSSTFTPPPALTPLPKPQMTEALAVYLRRERPFPDRMPRAWVIDLASSLSASEVADLDVLATGLYGEGRGRMLFLNIASDLQWPSLDDLVDVLHQQVSADSKQPLAIVALDELSGRAVLRLPPGLTTGDWEQAQVQSALNQMQTSGDSGQRCASVRHASYANRPRAKLSRATSPAR